MNSVKTIENYNQLLTHVYSEEFDRLREFVSAMDSNDLGTVDTQHLWGQQDFIPTIETVLEKLTPEELDQAVSTLEEKAVDLNDDYYGYIDELKELID